MDVVLHDLTSVEITISALGFTPSSARLLLVYQRGMFAMRPISLIQQRQMQLMDGFPSSKTWCQSAPQP
jgi:hypothetical protein